MHLVDLLAGLVELGQAAELAVDPAGGVDLGAERGDGGEIDGAAGGDPGAELVGRGGAVDGGEAELGVGPAVHLAEQAPVLRQPDGFVPVLPAGQLGLQAGRAHDRDVVCRARWVMSVMTVAAE